MGQNGKGQQLNMYIAARVSYVAFALFAFTCAHAAVHIAPSLLELCIHD